MRKNLTGWKASSLSFAGRITLAQSSLANLPGYVMQTSSVPVSICDEAKRLCRNFIWRSTADNRKCHLISWSKICTPKEEGGLGLRDLRSINKVYMMKLAWSLVADSDKLWVKVMKAKYNCGVFPMPKVASRSSCSNA